MKYFGGRIGLFVFTLVLLFFPAFLFGVEVIEANNIKVLAEQGKGRLLDVNGTRVLIVQGEPYEMGYQHGRLLKDEVTEICKRVLMIARAAQVSGFVKMMGALGDERFAEKTKDYFNGNVEEAFKRTEPYIDKRFREEMRGLADGAGLPVKDVELCNIFPELFHCSGFALMGNATRGGRLYHGRILDYMTEAGLQDYAVMTIARPEGFNAFATVGYAGFIGSVTGINFRQIAVGEMGGGGVGKWDGVPMTFLVRKALEEANTLEKAISVFRYNPRTCEYYYVVSDGKKPNAAGLACTPDLFQVVIPGGTHEKLPRPVEDCVLLSAGDRYNALVDKVKAAHGGIDERIALELMDRPVAMNSCLHRVLFAPQSLEIWVANAASVYEENFQACYQPYYHYRLKDFRQFFTSREKKQKAKRE